MIAYSSSIYSVARICKPRFEATKLFAGCSSMITQSILPAMRAATASAPLWYSCKVAFVFLFFISSPK